MGCFTIIKPLRKSPNLQYKTGQRLGIPPEHKHTGKCKNTLGYYNELMQAKFRTGDDGKGKQNLYLLTLFLYKLAFIVFVMTAGAQTVGNIAVYGSAMQLLI